MKNLLMLFAVSLILFSCKARKNAENSTNGNDSISVIKKNKDPKELNQPVNDHYEFFVNVLTPVKFDHLKINSKIDIISDRYVPTLNATIYIEKEQKIWANLSALFINVARAKITAEGVKGYNKTEKTYIDTDFHYLNKMLNVNFIDYKTAEKLLMGRTFIPIKDSGFKISKNYQGYHVESIANQRIENEGQIREYKIEINYSPEYDLKEVSLRDVNSSDELNVSYANYESFKGMRLPKNVKIIIKGSKNSEILLENTTFDDSKMETPYSVPNNYTKTEIK